MMTKLESRSKFWLAEEENFLWETDFFLRNGKCKMAMATIQQRQLQFVFCKSGHSITSSLHSVVCVDGLIKKDMVSHWRGNKWHFNKGTDVRDLFMDFKVLKRMKAE